ncbi:MAG TPA: hypothetical protein VNU26_07315 [Mycobacteriales bacterium]|nr:hypothetical protein [Mycobacteriales bacterium]
MRRAGTTAALLLAAAMSGVAGAPGTAAQEQDGATGSSRTVPWLVAEGSTSIERHPDDGPDGADPSVFASLRDWTVTVAQTRDLLNQTVEVRWTGGGRTGNGLFVQLMQCWSDTPDTQPRREQCAFGGITREDSSDSGAVRTRQLGADPRERTYVYSGGLSALDQDGARLAVPWAPDTPIVMATQNGSCPDETARHGATLFAPRELVTSGVVAASEPLGSAEGKPRRLTRTENGFERVYTVVSPTFVPGSRPDGVYRVELDCTDASGALLRRFVGYVEHVTRQGVPGYRVPSREGGVGVPFDPIGNAADLGPTDPYLREDVLEYLKPRSSNEVVQAKNTPDGGGVAYVEMQTDLEAPHLGCGRADATTGCWLVAVPRWAGEPDGSPFVQAGASPLSQTLWDRRIAVPLSFAPVASGCRIGSGLKQLVTHDAALSALRSWQPQLCDDPTTASSVIGPLQDFAIRAGIDRPNRLGVVGVPDQGLPTTVVAPLATSGVVVGFAVDRRIRFGSDRYAEDGVREEVMNLTPRLVAKLLTQSYQAGAAPNGVPTPPRTDGGFTPVFTPARNLPAGNPPNIYLDPEFRAANPQIVSWLELAPNIPPFEMGDVLVAASDSDAYNVLWRWVLSDPAAKAFLAGAPDEHGMRINPYYKDQVSPATSSFTLLDPTCADVVGDPKADALPLLCQADNHPRVENETAAARAAVRGDTRKVNVAPAVFLGVPGEILTYGAEARQADGRRAMLVVSNSAVAARYNLPVARLRNAGGEFVAPTPAALAAARASMTSRADGVLVPDPAAVRGAGYPLATMSYAVVDVAATSADQNEAFARILEYAAGPGQTPGLRLGQLPPGYAPLSAPQRDQLRAAAKTLRDPSSLLEQDEPEEPDGGAVQPPPAGDEPVPGGGAEAGGPTATAAVDAGAMGPTIVPADPLTAPVAAVAPPQVASPRGSTERLVARLPWLIPALAVGAVLAALAGRVLTAAGGATPLLPAPFRRPAQISGALRAGGTSPNAPSGVLTAGRNTP